MPGPPRQGRPKDEGCLAEATAGIPLKRPQVPDDIAHAVLFMSSDLVAGTITGEALSVNGGIRVD